MTFGTKSAIKSAYLQGLRDTYEWARGPMAETGLKRAANAADLALDGKIKLEGDIWFRALADNGVQKAATRKMIADLPA